MREEGVVVKVTKDTVDICVTMNEGCHNCGNKDACGTTGKTITAQRNGYDAQPGDTAVVEIPGNSLIALVVFMVVPLALLFLGYFVGKSVFGSETGANLSGAGGLVAGFGIVFLLGKANVFSTRPLVSAVIKKGERAAEQKSCCQ